MQLIKLQRHRLIILNEGDAHGAYQNYAGKLTKFQTYMKKNH